MLFCSILEEFSMVRGLRYSLSAISVLIKQNSDNHKKEHHPGKKQGYFWLHFWVPLILASFLVLLMRIARITIKKKAKSTKKAQ